MKKFGLFAVAAVFALSMAAGCKQQQAPAPAPAPEQKAPVETTAAPEGTQAPAAPAPAK